MEVSRSQPKPADTTNPHSAYDEAMHLVNQIPKKIEVPLEFHWIGACILLAGVVIADAVRGYGKIE